MKKNRSLQQIEDFYISQGLKGEDLRKAWENDREYQALLKAKKSEIKSKYGITPEDETKYILPTEEDYKILSTIRELRGKNLNENDKQTLDLVESQLLDDWRTPLEEKLEEIKQRYS